MVKRLHPGWLFLGILLTATGCTTPSSTLDAPTLTQGSPLTASPAATPTPSPATASQASTTPPSPTTQPFLISAEGIGPARLGMTYGQLKQQVEPGTRFEVKSPFMVDFDAIAVSRDGKAEYYILYLEGTTFSDSDPIQGLLTDNPAFRTSEGIGPGTSLKRAAANYGKVTLSYNTQNESREYARFQSQPAPNISFATGNGNAETAGVYPSPTGEFNETQEYREDAAIQSVLVVCLSDSCAP